MHYKKRNDVYLLWTSQYVQGNAYLFNDNLLKINMVDIIVLRN